MPLVFAGASGSFTTTTNASFFSIELARNGAPSAEKQPSRFRVSFALSVVTSIGVSCESVDPEKPA